MTESIEPTASEVVVVITARRGWVPIELGELWDHRELIFFLAWRDIKVRYKQTILGIGWAVLQPVMTMVVFTVLFSMLLDRSNMPTLEGIPYPVSTYCALVPWGLFARAVISSGDSLVNNHHIITRVYFPRLVAPIAPILAALVDFGLAFVVLIGIMIGYGITPGVALLALPLFVLLAMATALAISLWLSALNAIYRDVRYTLGFLVQIWMYVSPVVYTTENVMAGRPEWLRVLYGLNPMAGVVEGFRWALLGAPSPPATLIATSAAVVGVLLVGGLYFFRRMERTLVDLV